MLDKYINEYLRTHSDEALEGIILETKSMVYHKLIVITIIIVILIN